MITRRELMKGAAAAAVVSPVAAEAQQAGTVYRIGYLTVPGRESAHGVADTFELARCAAWGGSMERTW
jgi:hypothetical protein